MDIKNQYLFRIGRFAGYVFFCCFFCLMLSCISRQSNEVFKFSLRENGDLRFRLDSATSNNSLYLQFFFDKISNKELLAYLNKQKPSIIFFDIKNQNVFKEIILQRDGPNGVGRPTGAYPMSLDSIFIISAKTYEVSLVNSHGDVLKKVKLLDGGNYNENTGLIQPYATSLPFVINNRLYFSVAPDRNMYDFKYYEAHTNSTLDLSTGAYTYFGNFPISLQGKIWGVRGGQHSWVISPANEFVSSFSVQDSLVVWRERENKKSFFFAGSSFKKSTTLPFENPDESRDLSGYALQTTYYEGLIFDTYRNVYYRLACLPIEPKDSNGNLNDIFNKPISIIILDKDLNVIGEKRLRDNTYLFYMFFVGKDGLYFAKSNPHYKELEEDYLVFTRFILSK